MLKIPYIMKFNFVGTRISNLRKSSGMTQEEVAEMVGVTRQTYANWEKNKVSPDLNSLYELSGVFNVDVSYLLGESSSRRMDLDYTVKEYGISTKAADILRDYQASQDGKQLMALSFLIEDRDFLEVLSQCMCDNYGDKPITVQHPEIDFCSKLISPELVLKTDKGYLWQKLDKLIDEFRLSRKNIRIFLNDSNITEEHYEILFSTCRITRERFEDILFYGGDVLIALLNEMKTEIEKESENETKVKKGTKSKTETEMEFKTEKELSNILKKEKIKDLVEVVIKWQENQNIHTVSYLG
jgi:transcriptional regulator with XRE-family HTH domain